MLCHICLCHISLCHKSLCNTGLCHTSLCLARRFFPIHRSLGREILHEWLDIIASKHIKIVKVYSKLCVLTDSWADTVWVLAIYSFALDIPWLNLEMLLVCTIGCCKLLEVRLGGRLKPLESALLRDGRIAWSSLVCPAARGSDEEVWVHLVEIGGGYMLVEFIGYQSLEELSPLLALIHLSIQL